jgi:hypothetical protein
MHALGVCCTIPARPCLCNHAKLVRGKRASSREGKPDKASDKLFSGPGCADRLNDRALIAFSWRLNGMAVALSSWQLKHLLNAGAEINFLHR